MVRLVATSDWHIGAATTDVDQIKAIAKKYWLNKPVILLGDLMDIGLTKGMEFNQKYHPQEQLNLVEEITSLLDVKAYCLGNHSLRIYERTGLNPFETLFHMKPTNFYKIGKKEIYFSHGKSAAQNIFLEHHHLLEWIEADVIMLGHNHALASIPYVKSSGKIVHLVRTGAFIGHANYAKRAGLAPNIKGWVEYDNVKHVIYKFYIDRWGRVKEI